MALTKAQGEVLKEMQRKQLDTIYMGCLGKEGLGLFGMSLIKLIRRGTAAAFISNGLADMAGKHRVKLNEAGKTFEVKE